MSLKEIAGKLGIEPRRARALLRKTLPRKEDLKRARWTFTPAEAPGVVAALKKALEAKPKEEAKS